MTTVDATSKPEAPNSHRERLHQRFLTAKRRAELWAHRAYGRLICRQFGGALASWPDSPGRAVAEERSVREMEQIADQAAEVAARLYVSGGCERDPYEDSLLAGHLRDAIEVCVTYKWEVPQDVALIDEVAEVPLTPGQRYIPLSLTVSYDGDEWRGDVTCRLESIRDDHSRATYSLAILE